MARGWESKSVEDQVAAAAEERSRRGTVSRSPEERERDAKRAGLLLSRVKIAKDLESAGNPNHRALLERTLAHLDAQLADLEPGT